MDATSSWSPRESGGSYAASDPTDVAAFLSSINASCSLGHGSQQDGAAAASTPDLPISATVSLIEAQIDQLENAITSTIDQNRDTFTSHLDAGAKIEADLDHLYLATLEASDQIAGLAPAVSPALHDYNAALAQSTYQQWTIDAIDALLEATIQLEHAESLLSSGQVAALCKQLVPLRQSIAAFENHTGSTEQPGKALDLGFLSHAAKAPNPAVQELCRRVVQVESGLKEVVDLAWAGAITLDRAKSPTAGAKLVIRGTIDLAGPAEGNAISLPDLMGVLAERQALAAGIRAVAVGVFEHLARPLLNHMRSPSPRVRHQASAATEPASFSVRPVEEDARPSEPIPAIISLLSFVKAHLFDGLEDARSRDVQGVFAGELVPRLIPAVLSTLDGALPSSVGSVDGSLQTIHEQAAEATSLERWLRGNGFAAPSRAPSEDEDANDNAYALARWADDVGAHFSRRLAGGALDRARRLILAEGQGSAAGSLYGSGWEAEVIEVDSKMAQLESALSSQQQALKDDAREVDGLLQSAGMRAANAEENQDDASGWGDFEEPWTNGDAGSAAKHSVTNVRMARRSPRPSSSGSSARPGSSSGHHSGSSTPRTDSPSGVGGRKAKAKLGGVRVIRPQDQLGSGPFNTADVPIDDASWGLDDEDEADGGVAAEPTVAESLASSTSSLPPPVVTKASLARFSPQPEPDATEDDPWFTSEQDDEVDNAAVAPVKAHAAASAHGEAPKSVQSSSMQPSLSHSSTSSSSSANLAAFAVQSVPDAAEGEDDAWALSDEDEVEAPPLTPTANIIKDGGEREFPNATQTASRATDAMPSQGDSQEGEEGDDDPWGLSEEQAAEQAALAEQRTARSNDKLDQARDDADDAWQLDDEDAMEAIEQAAAPQSQLEVRPESKAEPEPEPEPRNDHEEISALNADPTTVTQSASPPPPLAESTSMSRSGSSFLPADTLEDDEEDAWGLKEEEAKRLSMLLMAPPQLPKPEDDDGDAIAEPHQSKAGSATPTPSHGLHDVAEANAEDEVEDVNGAEAEDRAEQVAAAPSEAELEFATEPEQSDLALEPVEADERARTPELPSEPPTHDRTQPAATNDSNVQSGPTEPVPLAPADDVSGSSEARHEDAAAAAAVDEGDDPWAIEDEDDDAPSSVLHPQTADSAPLEASAVPIESNADQQGADAAVASHSPSHLEESRDEPAEATVQDDVDEEDDEDAWAFEDEEVPGAAAASPQTALAKAATLTSKNASTRPRPSAGQPAYGSAAAHNSAQRSVDRASPALVVPSAEKPVEAVEATSAPIQPPAPMPEPAPGAVKEKCTISKRSIELIRLAEQVLADGLRLHRQQSSADRAPAPPPAAPVLAAVCDIFDLHRSLMPVAHGEALRDVPALAMQFANDCDFIARQVERIVAESKKAFAEVPAEDGRELDVFEKLDGQARLTRALGQRWFDAQMATQTKTLQHTLSDTPFSHLFEPRRYERCERGVKQVLHTLVQLSKAWRPILPLSSYLAAMGQLVEAVLRHVLAEVLELEDIGETESQRLADAIKMLGQIEECFVERQGETTTKVAFYVPSWFKASYLIEILTGSLVDIDFLAFEAHALVDYNRKELSGLIKALFTDTANRARLLDKIDRADVSCLLP
ncbi:uncharacterized protein PFL1_05344 [Pseudozyma flocculosa PF-1]|uniref:Retrograde transport protein Dsl1 C-terminal domain-containing protein n=2 Tax=Pseudozyma flocculosa TaxID=84751 RepID=A0A5C3FFL7_9BASI|nr:uncharacterized protein PFL1_05344 [Pseudozyma flocculosa PF-1]EPQ27060.1 hypothetical protein PFL1_05344 [Pseudozyma flocculosa PF-1]SPO42139.1 uncharacterized protein PSFLO_07622 [Pseudozyma flocculosa]